MIPGIHDSRLVSYEVNQNTKRLTVGIEPAQNGAAPFKIGFDGYAAHSFLAPLMPAILTGIFPEAASKLIGENWQLIESGYRSCGWPGAWGSSLDAALAYVAENRLIAYKIESSYGLSGWVLARSVSKLGRKPA